MLKLSLSANLHQSHTTYHEFSNFNNINIQQHPNLKQNGESEKNADKLANQKITATYIETPKY